MKENITLAPKSLKNPVSFNSFMDESFSQAESLSNQSVHTTIQIRSENPASKL